MTTPNRAEAADRNPLLNLDPEKLARIQEDTFARQNQQQEHNLEFQQRQHRQYLTAQIETQDARLQHLKDMADLAADKGVSLKISEKGDVSIEPNDQAPMQAVKLLQNFGPLVQELITVAIAEHTEAAEQRRARHAQEMAILQAQLDKLQKPQ